MTVTPVEPNQNVELRQPMPGFAEAQAAFAAEGFQTPKLRTIEGNPKAARREGVSLPKFRVIDGK